MILLGLEHLLTMILLKKLVCLMRMILLRRLAGLMTILLEVKQLLLLLEVRE